MAPERRRYRKILTRMWGDDKFRELSKPKPNGQTLWQYLITGQHTTAVPGLFTAGEAALAEALEWPLSGFRRAWAEIASRGMAEADWRARVVWLPNAIRHNAPESPNVVRGWRDTLDDVPECALKTKALGELQAYLEECGEAFVKAFRDLSVHPLPNQEQEQEQEDLLGEVPSKKPSSINRDLRLRFDEFWRHYPRKVGKEAAWRAWQKLRPSDELLKTMLAVLAWQRKTEDWQKEDGRFIPHPGTWLNGGRWEDEAPPAARRHDEPQRPSGCRHEPACVDAATHTKRDLAERRQAS